MDADSSGSFMSQRLHSTYKGGEKDKSIDSDIWSRKAQDDIEERFATLKKMLDEDPYGVLFGQKLQTKSSEDVPSSDSTNFRPATGEGTLLKQNAQDLNDSKYGSSGLRQKASSRSESEPPLKNAATESVSELARYNEELEFDPITMRKVAKKRSKIIITPPELDTDNSFNIPVKPFKSSSPTNLNTSATTPRADTQTSPQPAPSEPKPFTVAPTLSEPRRGWLARESHKLESALDRLAKAMNKPGQGWWARECHNIDSSIDRHVKAMGMPSDQTPADSSPLKYPINENTEEDIDLLRASDVRASAGRCRGAPKHTAAQKQERRSILSDDYARRSHQLDRRLEEELARETLKSSKIHAEVVDSVTESEKDHPVAVSEMKTSSPSMSTDESLQPESDRRLSEATSSSPREARERVEARRTHEIEVDAHKAAMEAIESRDKLEPSKLNIEAVRSQGAGESGTASNIEIVAGKTSAQESDHQLNKDKTLIDEIRSIYEDRYGTIDTNHRQPSIEAAKMNTAKTELGNAINLRKATNETVGQTINSADLDKRVRDDQRPLHKADNVPITTEPSANSGDSSRLKPQDHKMGDQSDTCRQLLREVYETQNLIRDLSRRISESQLPQPSLTESPSRPYVTEQNLHQSPNSSSLPAPGQGKFNSAEEITSNEQAKLYASSNPASSHFDPGLPSSDASENGETASVPVSYKILAYDPTTQRVTAAKNTFLTSPASERRPTVAEALSGLTNPAKFLPHLASLQTAGYEIVSGSSSLLIFQKTDPEKPSETSIDEHVPEVKDRYSLPTNPIDGTTPQTGNFASPTGFVNYDSILPTPDSEEGTTWQNYPRAPKSGDNEGREETVFSGGWRDSHEEKAGKWAKLKGRQRRRRRWRRVKRMLWVGSCVAGCGYIAGVTSEVFGRRERRKPSALSGRIQ